MHHAAPALRRRLGAGALIACIALALAASLSAGPATAASRACDIQAHVSRILSLRSYERGMAPARTAFFRRHRGGHERRAFVARQAARLARLKRALARCAPPKTNNAAAESANGSPPDLCSPTLSAAPGAEMNEGIIDSRLSLGAEGTLPAVMLFVDFPDVHASESARQLYDRLVPNARAWLNEVSNGRAALQVTPILRWYRMPHGSRDYGLGDGVSFVEQWRYIADAVAAADPDVDFSPFRIVYVVSARGSALERSPAFHAFAGDGIPADRTELRYGATFGEDIRDSGPRYPSYVLIHETGHMLGLPDLYDVPTPTYWSLLRFAGGWDIMSWTEPGAHLLAWHKWKLGWLDPSQLTCLTGPGELTATLTPAAEPRGLKAVVVPISRSTDYVVEARRRIGQDARLCADGVLVYSVDATIRSGYGPVRVRAAQRDRSSDLLSRCGPLYAAPFSTGHGRVAVFRDDAAGVTVRVLGSSAAGYRVLVSRSSSVVLSSVRRSYPSNAVDDEEAGNAPPVNWGLAGFLGGWSFLSRTGPSAWFSE